MDPPPHGSCPSGMSEDSLIIEPSLPYCQDLLLRRRRESVAPHKDCVRDLIRRLKTVFGCRLERHYCGECLSRSACCR